MSEPAAVDLDLILPDTDLAGRRMLLAMTVAVLALMAESLLGLALYLGLLPPLLMPLLHLLVVVLLAGAAWRCRMQPALLRGLVLLTGSTLVFGPLGPAGTILALLLYPTMRRRRPDFEAWYAELFPEPTADLARDTLDRIAWSGDAARLDRSVASFTDILTYGTAGQKQTLINLIAERYRPEFAPVLQRALMHTDPTIRVLTATAVSMIEGRMQAELRRRRAAVADAPADADAQLALAMAFDDYAHCGLLDADRRGETEDQARQTYEAARQVAPTAMLAQIDRSLGRLYLRMQRPEQALAALDRAAIAEALPPSHLAWRLECLYRLGLYSRLRLAVIEDWQGLEVLRSSNLRLADTLHLWARDEPLRVAS